jgi:PAS domain S-box-containing protein
MESLFQVLVNAADGAFVIDEDQHIVYWNQAAQEILGYTPDEVIGRNCYEILRGYDDKDKAICRHHCHVATTALTGSSVTTYDTCVRTKAGEVRWINVSILTFPNSDNVAPLVVHLFRDATQEKQNEQFARQVLSAAERLRESSITQTALSASADSSAKERATTFKTSSTSSRSIADWRLWPTPLNMDLLAENRDRDKECVFFPLIPGSLILSPRPTPRRYVATSAK